MSTDLDTLVKEYLEYEPCEKFRNELEGLLAKGDADALSARMMPRIAFGTAGLRARMAAGYRFMNDLTVLQASQGLVCQLKEEHKEEEPKDMSVVVGFDARHNSRRFGVLTAAVFASAGFRVHLCIPTAASDGFAEHPFSCTPLVPFGVLQKQAVCGVMVTASHNPKDDNGYKVYWSNGAQIVSPTDSQISAHILANLRPWKDYSVLMQQIEAGECALVDNPADELVHAYMETAKEKLCFRDNSSSANVKVAYTAMHGVGAPYIAQVFRAFGLPQPVPTPQQQEPHPDFPTVQYPNPEEGAGALALAMTTAKQHDCTVILANDPDADRLAVAELQESGDWRVFNGNEIAALFADWLLRKTPRVPGKKPLLLASTVSSKFLGAMADAENAEFVDTLTGFKWLGSVAASKQATSQFLFAYEVEIGFLSGDMSWDKDGVRMAAVFAELAGDALSRGLTLSQQLDMLRAKYGYYEMNTSYFFCGDEALEAIFRRLRNFDGSGDYPRHVGDVEITGVRDVTLGVDTRREDRKCQLPQQPSSQMLTFYMEKEGAVATLRNSGTEPKVKYYVECSDRTDAVAARAKCDRVTQLLIEHLVQPQVHGLRAKGQ
ncbi:MAG: hypothetical protein MHM6MM_001363 [Cercozoa sp. M6MM]